MNSFKMQISKIYTKLLYIHTYYYIHTYMHNGYR